MNFEEDDYDEFAHQELIHIHKVNTRGRKCETRVVGLPDIFDYKKILKFWKNVSIHSCRTSKPTAESPKKARSPNRKAERKRKSPMTKIRMRFW